MAEGKTNSAIAADPAHLYRLRRKTHRLHLHEIEPGHR